MNLLEIFHIMKIYQHYVLDIKRLLKNYQEKEV